MKSWKTISPELVKTYDAQAQATDWYGPEAAFGLAYHFVEPGQSILELGIGTGLGSTLFQKAGLEVHGLDISDEMLNACRAKGIKNLTRHDLGEPPYPFADGSMDHTLCTGVLNFFPDPFPLLGEAARIIKQGGTFTFLVLDRKTDETPEVKVEHPKPGQYITFYRHSPEQVQTMLAKTGLAPLRQLRLLIYMNRTRAVSLPGRIWLAQKG